MIKINNMIAFYYNSIGGNYDTFGFNEPKPFPRGNR